MNCISVSTFWNIKANVNIFAYYLKKKKKKGVAKQRTFSSKLCFREWGKYNVIKIIWKHFYYGNINWCEQKTPTVAEDLHCERHYLLRKRTAIWLSLDPLTNII